MPEVFNIPQSEIKNQLPPEYQSRIAFPGDEKAVADKAVRIAKTYQPGVSEFQQAIIVLDLKSLTEIRSLVQEMWKSAGHPPDWKTAELDLLESLCHTQAEYEALLGLGTFNATGVVWRLDLMTLDRIQILKDLFTVAEIVAILSGFNDKFMKQLGDRGLSAADIARFRQWFTTQEQLIILKEHPSALFGFGTENSIGDIALERFRALDEVSRSILFKHFEPIELIRRLGADAKLRLATFKQVFGDGYEDFLTSNDAPRTLRDDLSNLEFTNAVTNSETILSDVFEGPIPWKTIFGDRKNGSKSYSILGCSPEKIRNALQALGPKITRAMVLKESRYFQLWQKETTEIDGLFITLRSMFGDKFVEDLIMADHHLYWLPKKITSEQLVDLVERIGKEKVQLILRSFMAQEFLAHYDRIEIMFPAELLEKIFSLAAENDNILHQIGDYFDYSNWEEAVDRAIMPLLDNPIYPKYEYLLLILKTYQLQKTRLYTFFFDWVKTLEPPLAEAILRLHLTSISAENTHQLQRDMESLQALFELLGRDRFLKIILDFRKSRKLLTTINGRTEAIAELGNQATDHDIDFLIQQGLFDEALKRPTDVKKIMEDVNANLKPLFEMDPLLMTQAPEIVKRLEELRAEGKSIENLLRVLCTRLAQPNLTDIDKIWLLYSRIMGKARVLAGSDPALSDASFAERVRATYNRLLDVHELSVDRAEIEAAHDRNVAFAEQYQPDKPLSQPVLLHGKSAVFNQDLHLGFRSSDFLGKDQYPWADKTANALNGMALYPDESSSLLELYVSQPDQIAASFGASVGAPAGITHMFGLEDVNQAHKRYPAEYYDCNIHSRTSKMEHKLIWVGLPTTAELAAFITTKDPEWVEKTKMYYAKQPFYVPLLDVNTGEIIFMPEAYQQLRQELLRTGQVVEIGDQESVTKVIERLKEYYSTQDQAHGIDHIENALQHVNAVCMEIFDQNKEWFTSNQLTFDEYQSLVKLAVVGHDVKRGTSEDQDHAVAGANEVSKTLDYGLQHRHLQLVVNAIKQHNLPREARWSDDPVTQALYDIDKADTKTERGADAEYIKLILPTIVTDYTKEILNTLLTSG